MSLIRREHGVCCIEYVLCTLVRTTYINAMRVKSKNAVERKPSRSVLFSVDEYRVVLVLDNGAIYQATPDRGQGHQSITECIWYFGKIGNMKGWRSVFEPKNIIRSRKILFDKEYFYSIKKIFTR